MRVLHVNEHLARKGGVETYLLALLPMLRDRGIDSHVAFGAGEKALWPQSHHLVEVGSASSAANPRARERLIDLISVVRPDVVHLHNVQNLSIVEASLDSAPTIMTAHDYRSICPANTFYFRRTQSVCQRDSAGLPCFVAAVTKRCLTPRPAYARYFYRRAARWTAERARFARVIAPSYGAQQRLLRAGFASERVTILPYFCPVTPADQPRAIPVVATVTYMGRVTRNKGYAIFVTALGKLPRHIRGVMVGNFDKGAEDTVMALARLHACSDRLELRRWASREEVMRTMDESTVFVFPSLWPETLGIVGLEALSRGVPVVASDIGGVREWLIEGETGRLVPPGDADALAKAVLEIAENREMLSEMGRRGIALIRERFLPDTHADTLVRLYHDTVEGYDHAKESLQLSAGRHHG